MYGAHKYSVFKNPVTQETILGSEVSPDAAKKLETISTGAHNWKNGLKITEIVDSTIRHLLAVANGEDIDPESGLPHTGHLYCNVMFLEWVQRNRPDLDDRDPTILPLNDNPEEKV